MADVNKKQRIICILIALLLSNVVISSMHSQAQATEHLMEENDVEGGGVGLSIYSGFNVAQCFYASGNYILTNVSLFVMDEDPWDNFLTVEIFDNDDQGTPGFPDDDVPGSSMGPAPNANWPDNFFEWLDFPFSVPLIGGSRYWIVARSSEMDGEGYRWKDSEFDSYPGGYLAFDGNPVWAVDNFNDMMFRVFGEVDNDVGVEELIAPRHQELYREVEINAFIKNYGANDQEGGFGVQIVIWDPFGSVVLNDVKTITSLDSGETTNLIWNFIPIFEGIYFIDVVTQLLVDEYPANDWWGVDINIQAAAS